VGDEVRGPPGLSSHSRKQPNGSEAAAAVDGVEDDEDDDEEDEDEDDEEGGGGGDGGDFSLEGEEGVSSGGGASKRKSVNVLRRKKKKSKLPYKWVLDPVELTVRCDTPLVDFEGRPDATALRNMLTNLKPRRLVVAYGPTQASFDMRDHGIKALNIVDGHTKLCFAPAAGHGCVMELDARSFEVLLHDLTVKALHFQTVGGVAGVQVAHVRGGLRFLKTKVVPGAGKTLNNLANQHKNQAEAAAAAGSATATTGDDQDGAAAASHSTFAAAAAAAVPNSPPSSGALAEAESSAGLAVAALEKAALRSNLSWAEALEVLPERSAAAQRQAAAMQQKLQPGQELDPRAKLLASLPPTVLAPPELLNDATLAVVDQTNLAATASAAVSDTFAALAAAMAAIAKSSSSSSSTASAAAEAASSWASGAASTAAAVAGIAAAMPSSSSSSSSSKAPWWGSGNNLRWRR